MTTVFFFSDSTSWLKAVPDIADVLADCDDRASGTGTGITGSRRALLLPRVARQNARDSSARSSGRAVQSVFFARLGVCDTVGPEPRIFWKTTDTPLLIGHLHIYIGKNRKIKHKFYFCIIWELGEPSSVQSTPAGCLINLNPPGKPNYES